MTCQHNVQDDLAGGSSASFYHTATACSDQRDDEVEANLW